MKNIDLTNSQIKDIAIYIFETNGAYIGSESFLECVLLCLEDIAFIDPLGANEERELNERVYYEYQQLKGSSNDDEN